MRDLPFALLFAPLGFLTGIVRWPQPDGLSGESCPATLGNRREPHSPRTTSGNCSDAAEYLRAMTEAELAWVQRTIEDVDRARLTWNREEIARALADAE